MLTTSERNRIKYLIECCDVGVRHLIVNRGSLMNAIPLGTDGQRELMEKIIPKLKFSSKRYEASNYPNPGKSEHALA